MISRILFTLVFSVASATFGHIIVARADDVNTILTNLGSERAEVRAAALQRLRSVPVDARCADPLVRALEDSSADVRREAARTIGSIADRLDGVVGRSVQPSGGEDLMYGSPGAKVWMAWQQRVADNLGKTALDDDPNAALEAARSLAKLGTDGSGLFMIVGRCGTGDEWLLWIKVHQSLSKAGKARPDLFVRLLSDSDANVVSNAAGIAAKHVPHRSRPVMRRFLTDRRPEWRAIALRILNYLDTDPTIAIPFLGDRDDRVRGLAIYLLDKWPDLIEKLMPSYESSSVPFRKSLVELVRENAFRFGSLLLRAANDPDVDIRERAINVAAMKRVPLNVGYLRAMTHHRKASLRSEALRALYYQIKDGAESRLIEALEDPDEAVRETAMDYLLDIPRLDTIDKVIATFRCGRNDRNYSLAHAIGEIGPAAHGVVERLIKDSDWRIRAIGIQSAHASEHPRTMEFSKAALMDAHPSVCIAAASSIEDSSRSLLQSLRQGSDKRHRANALAALSYLGDSMARSDLNALASSKDPEMASFAKLALKSLESTGGIRP